MYMLYVQTHNYYTSIGPLLGKWNWTLLDSDMKISDAQTNLILLTQKIKLQNNFMTGSLRKD